MGEKTTLLAHLDGTTDVPNGNQIAPDTMAELSQKSLQSSIMAF
jgi:hypothetical protein